MKTIIAAFSDSASAQRALSYVQARGLRDARLMTHETGIIDRLRGYNVPDDKLSLYAEVMRRGAPVLFAHAEDDDARDIARELDNMGSLDLDAAAKRWQSEGWRGYDESAPYASEEGEREREMWRSESALEDRDLEVIQEKVAVGKRAVQRGGVRVRTFVTERPVNEQVELRNERIDVTRERVDERVSPEAMDSTLTEDEFEITAQGEEAVVGKEARVVERVHVGKQAETRVENVEATERRRDVEVEQIGAGQQEREHIRNRR